MKSFWNNYRQGSYNTIHIESLNNNMPILFENLFTQTNNSIGRVRTELPSIEILHITTNNDM